MNSRAVTLFTIGFWALALIGSSSVMAQGGDPGVPDGAVSDDAVSDGAVSDDAVSDDAVSDDADPDAMPESDGDSDAAPEDDGDSNAARTSIAPAESASEVSSSETADNADIAKHEISFADDDVAPTLVVYRGKHAELRMGGLIQLYFSPYVGDASLIANDDPVTSEGFRLRRARLGLEGRFGSGIGLRLVVNPLESDPDVGTLSTAEITYQFLPGMQVSVGTGSVPFTRAELESSSSLLGINRPLVARTIVPDKRLGVTVEGLVADRFGFVVAAMNSTEGYEQGNRFGGFIYAGRLLVNIIGAPSHKRPRELGVALSLGGLFDDGPATRALGASADLFVTAAGASVKLEAACDRTEPQDAPMPAPGLADDISRCGGYAELGYQLSMAELQPVLRVEYFDDNTEIEDAGDAMLFSAGVNARLRPYTRVQLHYISRRERFGENRANDSVVLNLQGDF